MRPALALESARPAHCGPNFRAVGTSRPVDLSDRDRYFALAVIEAWVAEVGEGELPQGIDELRTALRDEE